MALSVIAKFSIRIGAYQAAAGVMEIHAATTLSGIIQRLAQGRKIRDTAWVAIQRGRIAFKCKAGVDPDVPVEHAAYPVSGS